MIALAIVASLAIAASALMVTNALNQIRTSNSIIRESELSIRTHLQAQVDDLHAKLLAHDWAEYSNTVNQRSAFDRAVASEGERIQQAFSQGESFEEALERVSSGTFDEMEGPTVG